MNAAGLFARSLTTESTVTIAPEGSTLEIEVSKTLLIQTSDYFKTALEGRFKEAQDQKLRFPGSSVNVVLLFVFWVYHRTLPDFVSELRMAGWDRTVIDSTEILLINLWVFADAHFVPKLKNTVLDSLVRIIAYTDTSFEVIRQAFVLTPHFSKIRRFFIQEARYEHYMVRRLTNEQVRLIGSEFPEFDFGLRNPRWIQVMASTCNLNIISFKEPSEPSEEEAKSKLSELKFVRDAPAHY